MIPRMKGVAAEHGIEIQYGGTVGNTFDSHRLIWLAREVGGVRVIYKIRWERLLWGVTLVKWPILKKFYFCPKFIR